MKIDYMHGRRVEDVTHKGPDWHWEIHLEGGAIIRNQDQRRTALPDVIGTALLASEIDDTGNVNLQFGTVVAGDPPTITNETWVSMSQNKMVLAVPGEEVDLSEAQPEDDLPPDPSTERVADGPEKP